MRLHSLQVPASLATVGLGVTAVLQLAGKVVDLLLADSLPLAAITLLGLAIMCSWIFTAIVFIIWLYQARDNLGVRGETGLKWKPGWTIGGWFIPLANFVIPARVTGEVYARSVPNAYRSWSMPRAVTGWWICLILSVFRFTFTETNIYTRTVVVHFADFWNVVNAIFIVPAAVLAVLIVKRVTAWHTQWQPLG